MPQHLRRTGAALVAAALLTTLSACGSDGGDSGSSGSSGSSSAEKPVVVDITVADGSVTPSGDRVEVKAGQPVDLKVTADTAGEIHVHSDPEQEFAYEAGEKTFKLAIDRPGVVTVEDHALDKIIVQLEVR